MKFDSVQGAILPGGLHVLICPRCRRPINQHYAILPTEWQRLNWIDMGTEKYVVFLACARCGLIQHVGDIHAPEVKIEYRENPPFPGNRTGGNAGAGAPVGGPEPQHGSDERIRNIVRGK